MKNNRILPMGLKGNQINERMMQLMGVTQINENKSNIAVELTKMGPDGKAYAIIRENHEYYIKSTDKTSGLIAEDFKYIGGLQNKKQEAYPSYAKAIKHLNLKFNSIQEALDTRIDINVFEDDNLLKEDIAGFSNAYGGGFSGAGNLEGNSALYEEENVDDEDYGTNMVTGEKLPKPDPIVEEEDCEMTDEENAIDEMLTNESWMNEEEPYDPIANARDEYSSPMDRMYNSQDWVDAQASEIGEDHNGLDSPMGGNSNDELFNRIDTMTGEELVQFLKDAGQDIKNKFMSVISSGADRFRDKLNGMYPENESLYEGRLSINRAIDKMDSIIDSLGENDLKKKD